jgi:hypothetical protein
MIRHKLLNKTKSTTVTESKLFHQLNNPYVQWLVLKHKSTCSKPVLHNDHTHTCLHGRNFFLHWSTAARIFGYGRIGYCWLVQAGTTHTFTTLQYCTHSPHVHRARKPDVRRVVNCALVQFPIRKGPIWNSRLPCALNMHCSDSFVFGKNCPNFD